MEKSCLASCDGTLLHALSSDSVETYTSRAFQAAIGNLSRCSAVIPPLAEGGNWAEFGEGVRVTEDVLETAFGESGGEGEGEGEGGGEVDGEGEKREGEGGRKREREEGKRGDSPDPKTWLKQVYCVCSVYM